MKTTVSNAKLLKAKTTERNISLLQRVCHASPSSKYSCIYENIPAENSRVLGMKKAK